MHTTDKPAETQRNTELWCPRWGVGSVSVSAVTVHFCIPTNTLTSTSIPTGVVCIHLHQPAASHVCTYTMLLFFPHSSSLTCTQQNATHTYACTNSTHRLFLFSQLCSDIKQCPMRENKHADEERLAGHRGRQYTHKHTQKHINACTGVVQK